MVSRAVSLVVCVALTAGCRRPPEAPEELDELSSFLYGEWANEDPRTMEAGVENLLTFLEGVDLEANDVQDRSWELSPLGDEHVDDIERPERNLGDLVGVAVAYDSRWPVADHARVQTQADQRPFEPTAKDHYDRFFPELESPDCFIDLGCDPLQTFNEATRKNILMEVTFELHKNFRWVRMPGEEEQHAIVARSWFAEPWSGARENNTLWQSYSVDVWIPMGERTWRFQTLWSETDLGIAVSDKDVIATVRTATNSFFRNSDDAIETEFYAQ